MENKNDVDNNSDGSVNTATKRSLTDTDEVVKDVQAKKSRFTSESPVEMRLLIPSIGGGAIIGKGGEHIKMLRSKYNATVLVPDCPGPERIFTIVCYLGNACSVLLEALKFAHSSNKEVTVKLLVHQSQCGAIIGKAGSNIKEIRQKYGVHLKVYSQCAPNSTDRVVEIRGSAEVATNTAYHIMDMLLSCPPIGQNIAYNPINFNEAIVDSYGGYAGTYNHPRGIVNTTNNNKNTNRFNMNNMNNNMNNFDGLLPDIDTPKPLMNIRGGALSGNMGRNRARNFVQGYHSFEESTNTFNSNNNDDDDDNDDDENAGGDDCNEEEEDVDETNESNIVTCQVSIPNELAGSIIGKGGARIRHIRNESKALINIDDPIPGCDMRIITIVGTPRQIQIAQVLMQISVKQFSGKY